MCMFVCFRVHEHMFVYSCVSSCIWYCIRECVCVCVCASKSCMCIRVFHMYEITHISCVLVWLYSGICVCLYACQFSVLVNLYSASENPFKSERIGANRNLTTFIQASAIFALDFTARISWSLPLSLSLVFIICPSTCPKIYLPAICTCSYTVSRNAEATMNKKNEQQNKTKQKNYAY